MSQKFTEAQLEAAFTELIGNEGYHIILEILLIVLKMK